MENWEEFCVSASSSLKDSVFFQSSTLLSPSLTLNITHSRLIFSGRVKVKVCALGPLKMRKDHESFAWDVESRVKRTNLNIIIFKFLDRMSNVAFFSKKESAEECVYLPRKHFKLSFSGLFSLSLHFFHLRLSTSSRSKTLTKQLARCEIHKYTACDSHYFRTRFILLVAIPCRPSRTFFSLSFSAPSTSEFVYFHTSSRVINLLALEDCACVLHWTSQQRNIDRTTAAETTTSD